MSFSSNTEPPPETLAAENVDSPDFSDNSCLVAVPKSFLEKVVPTSSKNTGVGILKAATVQRDDFYDVSGVSFDERSPLISREIAKPKPGVRDDQQTFPKLVYLSASRTQLPDDIGTPILYSIQGSSRSEENELIDSTGTSNFLATEKKPSNRKIWILCSLILVLLLLLTAGILSYFFLICSKLPYDDNRIQQCTSANRMLSSCDFRCKPGFIQKGASNATCQLSRHWSAPAPTCHCPTCSAGPQCQYSIDWNIVSKTLFLAKLYDPTLVHYGNYKIACEAFLEIPSLKFSCRCKSINIPIQQQAKCSNFSGIPGACIHTLANLLHNATQKGYLPIPCNESEMQPYLDCHPPHN